MPRQAPREPGTGLKPWDDGYAEIKRQLGEWHIVVEGWEDTYASWLHDAQIKVEVGDDRFRRTE